MTAQRTGVLGRGGMTVVPSWLTKWAGAWYCFGAIIAFIFVILLDFFLVRLYWMGPLGFVFVVVGTTFCCISCFCAKSFLKCIQYNCPNHAQTEPRKRRLSPACCDHSERKITALTRILIVFRLCVLAGRFIIRREN